MIKTGFEQAMEIAIKMKNQFIFDMAKMEGNTATFEQVETIAEGISVGGLTTGEVAQVAGITKGWNTMLEMVKHKEFDITKDNACYLNMLISANENYNGLGGFRVRGVRITGTDYIPPRASDLDQCWDTMMEKLGKLPEDKQAMFLYMNMARNQFFGDGNKRTALTMMNGLLIKNGYAPITISRKENSEYRHILISYYERPDEHQEKFYEFLNKKQMDILHYWGYEEEIQDMDLAKTKEVLPNSAPIKTKKIVIGRHESKQGKSIDRT